MPDVRHIDGKLLARNTGLNILGQALPILIGIATVPYVVRELGAERFGILSIAWVLLGYFSIFDLGLGRATTKFMAEALGKGEHHRLPGLMWTSLGCQIVLGLVGGLVLFLLVPILVDRILKIPPALLHESKLCFWLLAAALPIILATTVARGALEAGQHFDLVNYVKVPSSVSVFVLPVVGLAFGMGLPGITLLLVLSRFGSALAYLILCLRTFPEIGGSVHFEVGLLRSLASYGGWITVANVINPILVYMDRFMIGALVSVSAVAYYTAPFDAVTKLWLIPSSLAATLFPGFSSVGLGSGRARVEALSARATKFLLLGLGPVVLLLTVFARPILEIWLGADFAAKSTVVLQILAVGVLANSITYIPYSLLQGLGRPEVVAKIFLLELPLYAGLVYLMVSRAGITGAALAWTIRVAVEMLVLMGVSFKVFSLSSSALTGNGLLRGAAALAALVVAVVGVRWIFGSFYLIQWLLSAISIAVFGWAVWRYILDDADRRPLLSMMRPILLKVGIAS